jgi:putative tryptophan/tyrosine transport system substrate-binding protein
MRRRDFLAILSSAAVTASRGASAQTENKTHRVGLFNPGVPVSDGSLYGAPLIRGLEKHGYSLGRNMAFERRGAEGRVEHLPRLLDELVASKVDVIFALGYPAALVAKNGTSLPVVVCSVGDPVVTGLVDNLARPGGHLTGIADLAAELAPKRLQLLKEMAPGMRRVAMLWNAGDPGMTLRYRVSEAAAQALGITVEALGVRSVEDFEPALSTMRQNMPDAMFIVEDRLTGGNRGRIFEFAATNRLPAMYELDALVRAGGLMSYGPDLDESLERAASLIDRILKGAKPQDLPFEQPARYRFAINLKTAKALGLAVPQSIVAQANDVIE